MQISIPNEFIEKIVKKKDQHQFFIFVAYV